MKSLGLSRHTLTIGAAAALLAGCGGSQPPIAEPGAMPQRRAIATHAGHGKSWMVPEAKSQDLLYVSSTNGVRYIFGYPKGMLVGILTGFLGGSGECVDSSGNVFLPSLASDSATNSIIYEYAHGGTQPIATLEDPGIAYGCSFDPKTGNLAVANGYDTSNPYSARNGSIAIYLNGQGTPNLSYSSQFGVLLCGYDNNSRLYVSMGTGQSDQGQLARLSSTGSFELLTLDKPFYISSEFIPMPQWDGSHMTVSFDPHPGLKESSPITVYQLSIKGRNGMVVRSSELNSKDNHHAGQTWIQGSTIVAAYYYQGYANIGFWSYPGGGSLVSSIKKVTENGHNLSGVTVSVAPR